MYAHQHNQHAQAGAVILHCTPVRQHECTPPCATHIISRPQSAAAYTAITPCTPTTVLPACLGCACKCCMKQAVNDTMASHAKDNVVVVVSHACLGSHVLKTKQCVCCAAAVVGHARLPRPSSKALTDSPRPPPNRQHTVPDAGHHHGIITTADPPTLHPALCGRTKMTAPQTLNSKKMTA